MHLEGTQAVAGQDLILDVGRDLLVESAQSGYGSFQSSSSKSFGVGVGFSLSAQGGFTVGLTANGSIAHARDQMSGLQNLNARLDAGETLTIVTGRDATLVGANVTGQDVLLDIDGDLTVASRQDTGHGASRSSSVGGSVFVGVGTSPVSGSVSMGAGRGSSDHAWVSDQTSIVARDTLDARVEGHTQIDGAVIASLTGDLVLDTGTLGFSDIHDHDKGSSWSAQAGVSASTGEKGKAGYTPTGAPTGASLSGHVAEHDREQETRATVGAGEIIIRDTENQTQDVAALNRDLDRAQAITKDERSGVEFYVSSSAIQEIASGFAGIRKNLQDLAERAGEGFPQITESLEQLYRELQAITSSLPDDLKHLGAAGELALETMLRAGIDAETAEAAMRDPAAQRFISGLASLQRQLETGAAGPVEQLIYSEEQGIAVVRTISASPGMPIKVLTFLADMQNQLAQLPVAEAQAVLLVAKVMLGGGPVQALLSVGVGMAAGAALEPVLNAAADAVVRQTTRFTPADGIDYDNLKAGARFGVELVLGVATAGSARPTLRPTTTLVNGIRVVDRYTGQVFLGTVDLAPTISRINAGVRHPHANDGTVFKNRPVNGTALLPQKPAGYYTEYVHPTPSVSGPGPQRIVVGQGGEMYYTPDHYRTFIPLN